LTARTHARNASNSRKQSFLAISAAFPRTHAAYVVTYSTNQYQFHNYVSVTHPPFVVVIVVVVVARASHRIASRAPAAHTLKTPRTTSRAVTARAKASNRRANVNEA
jgi:hypothetical protein